MPPVESPTASAHGRATPAARRLRASEAAAAVEPASVAAIAFLCAGSAAWVLSLRQIDLAHMSDIGMASVLPAGTWVALALVTCGFALSLWTGRQGLLLAAVLVTIVALHGLGVIAEPTMRFVVAWRHLGIADYIADHGSIDPGIDAYFNWPGFFSLTAFLTEITGLKNAEPIARWAPLAFNALYLAPLVVIGRSIWSAPRMVWLGIWLFYVNNWIGQDYYSPQGLSLFLYLVVLATLLRWFKGDPRGAGERLLRRVPLLLRATRDVVVVPDAAATPAQRVVLASVLLVVVAAVVPSHQLTPSALVAGTGALVLARWCRLRGFPVIVLTVALLWTSYLAVTYLRGHLGLLAEDVGAVNQSVGQNVSGRLKGSEGHEQIVYLRLAATALLWLTAAAGFVRGAVAGRAAVGLAVLAAAPFPLLAIQPYGGEVLLRIGLFTLPFMAFLAASLFVDARAGNISRRGWTLFAVFATVFVVSFPFTKYGNERMDYYTREEIAGVAALYRLAPAGSVLVAASDGLPWRSTGYADYDYRTLTDTSLPEIPLETASRPALVREVADRMGAGPGRRSFLIVTRSTKAQLDLFGPYAPGTFDRLERALLESRRFDVLFRNPDAIVFGLRPRGSGP